ncbi:hypothetical protein DL96DRAFT_1076472 [Flagelloscypha sp. PMI_526]|nr:hypothetical protein DL96DRAFT_1076472 [Flagelloscypha sp. PMI_526]
MYSDFDDRLRTDAVPLQDATLTVRIIKSFEYRTEKSLVLQHIDLTSTSVAHLKELAREAIVTQSGWKPYRNIVLDTLKLYTQAHGAKTTNLIINLENDDWILDDDTKLLVDLGFKNETEVSFFNKELYEAFKADPTTKWESDGVESKV